MESFQFYGIMIYLRSTNFQDRIILIIYIKINILEDYSEYESQVMLLVYTLQKIKVTNYYFDFLMRKRFFNKIENFEAFFLFVMKILNF